jgi:hypothetical protein
MFGDSFLVAPVLRPDGRCRVYLPAGRWVDYGSRQLQTGGRWVEMIADLECLPLWVRSGAIIPLGPDQNFVNEKPLDPLTLEIYNPLEAGEITIHDEDQPGISVRYWREAFDLHVEVGPAPGEVEVVLIGPAVRSARLGKRSLDLHSVPGGVMVRFDGRTGKRLVFQLATDRVGIPTSEVLSGCGALPASARLRKSGSQIGGQMDAI